jgi:glutamate-ammonia-ligase adenylyltransferase
VNPAWRKTLARCADPLRARHFLDLLSATPARDRLARASSEQRALLAALFSGSQHLPALLLTHPNWLSELDLENLRFARRKQGLAQEVQRWLRPLLKTGDFTRALGLLREFKQRELLRVGLRDFGRLARVPELTHELSDIADVCLDAVWQICQLPLSQKYGCPYHEGAPGQWVPTAGCVLGLGKLGGQELNYSSDVDVIFVYAEEGDVFKEPPPGTGAVRSRHGGRGPHAVPPPRPVLKSHQFFNRLAEAFIAEVTRLAPEGILYRIDLRLRPEGDLGPLARSLAGYENYYAQWGQTWERMMLMKGRGVAGDEPLAAEFLEMIQPFRYPRSISQGALAEVGAMKDRIEHEVVKTGELERNVKLGRGGIREIEFVAQALQLLHAGKQPFLQGSQTLPTLDKLWQYELLSPEAARRLGEAYIFLRDIEHRLQMEDNRQTHTIPQERVARERLARLMGFTTLAAFEAVLADHTREVRAVFEHVLKSEVPQHAGSAFPAYFEGAEAEWKALLERHRFKDVECSFRVLREFVEGPGYVHISPRTKELALKLLPELFGLCAQPESGAGPVAKSSRLNKRRKQTVELGKARGGKEDDGSSGQVPLSDPDRVVTRLDSFIGAYGARATLFELWAANPAIFRLLVLLFDRSEFLAELAIRVPDLVDELVTSGRLRQRKNSAETLGDLRHGLADPDQHLWLRRYHQAELMRIGLRDILGLADFEQYLTELSALAEACLQYALEVIMLRHRLKRPPFAIIGLGKLGGAEIDYGSDLDLVFVTDAPSAQLPRLARLALAVMELLSRRTEQGIVFHTDARLRPDGEKGLLVNSLAAYEGYYRQRAQLWEIQTLTRTRLVAGDVRVGAKFQALAAALANFEKPSLPLAAYTPDWKQSIHRMRLRIEKERTPAGQDDLAIKTGAGGLMDAEFIAQALCLEHGWAEPNTLRALERGGQTGALARPDMFLEAYRHLRRVEGILRRWSYEGETVLPVEPAPYLRVAIRCGFPNATAFRDALRSWRSSVREGYNAFFQLRNEH